MSIWIMAVIPMCGAAVQVFLPVVPQPMVSVMPGAAGLAAATAKRAAAPTLLLPVVAVMSPALP